VDDLESCTIQTSTVHMMMMMMMMMTEKVKYWHLVGLYDVCVCVSVGVCGVCA
jgi:hypothetical protein